MKKLLAFLLVGGSLAFQSCKDDDKPSNQVSYDGEKVKIGSVLHTDINDEGDGAFSHSVLVLSQGLSFDGEDIVGSGDVLELYFMTNTESEIGAGTYTIGEDLHCALYTDVVITDDNTTIGGEALAEAGTISVEKNGDKYTFVFDLTINGKKLTGRYNGTIKATYTE